MRKANVFVHGVPAGIMTEIENNRQYEFKYMSGYIGESVSLTMLVRSEPYYFDRFFPFFEGLLPEGLLLEGLLRALKIDGKDYFSQLMAVGKDMVGAVTVEPVK